MKPNPNEMLVKDDLDFISDSKTAFMLDNPSFASVILYTVILFLVVGSIWASIAEIDEVTHSEGKVVPSTRIQVVQNLEGGILSSIHTNKGDVVKKGQVLIRLDNTQAKSAYKKDYAKLVGLRAEIIRLKSQISNAEKLTFPVELQTYSDIIERERDLFNANKNLLRSSTSILRQSYELGMRELAITKPLAKKGLMSELELLRLERTVNELGGKLKEKYDTYYQSALEELTEAEVELASLVETLDALEDRMHRTTITAPADGTIHEVYVNTPGEIIQPGMDIIEIVPLNDKLLVEAKVPPADIAFIRPGQAAIIKLSAYDFAIYGGLDAVVTRISPNTVVDEKGNSFYEITLETKKGYIGEEHDPMPIIPGMLVTADVITGKKTIMDYLLKPILRAKHTALHER